MTKARYTPLQLVRFWLDTPRRILAKTPELEPAGDAMSWLRENAPALVHDRRAHPGQRFGKRGIPRGARAWDDIDGETFHQTAVGPGSMGRKTIRKVPAHGFVAASSDIHLLWDPRVVLWHANFLNDESIGIEIDCRAAGHEGDESTVWRSKKEKNGYRDKRGNWNPPVSAADVLREATDAQLEAGRVLGEYYGRLLLLNWSDDYRLVKVWAHRQGHKSRTTDPGSRIYRGVMEPLIEKTNYCAGEKQGNGKEIDPLWPSGPKPAPPRLVNG